MEGGIKLQVLNLPDTTCDPGSLDEVSSKEVSKCLRLTMLKLVSKHLDEVTGTVDYVSLPHTQEFSSFKTVSQRLILCNPGLLDGEERKAFFINIYNVLTMHALAEHHASSGAQTPVQSPLEIPHFWGRFAYQVGKFSFSLDDIEHGILRANRPHPTTLKKSFDDEDPRREWVIAALDPRIHFALNCGAKSCPMVSVYSSEKLEHQLDNATRSYLRQMVHPLALPIPGCRRGFGLPQIFEWYGHDFAADRSGVLRWMSKYFEGKTRDEILTLASMEEIPAAALLYEYDWSLNQRPQNHSHVL